MIKLSGKRQKAVKVGLPQNASSPGFSRHSTVFSAFGFSRAFHILAGALHPEPGHRGSSLRTACRALEAEKGQAAERTGDGAGTPRGLRMGQTGRRWRSRETLPACGLQHLPRVLAGGPASAPQSDVLQSVSRAVERENAQAHSHTERSLPACFVSGTAVVSGGLGVHMIWFLSPRSPPPLHHMVNAAQCCRNRRGFISSAFHGCGKQVGRLEREGEL